MTSLSSRRLRAIGVLCVLLAIIIGGIRDVVCRWLGICK